LIESDSSSVLQRFFLDVDEAVETSEAEEEREGEDAEEATTR
jgi:hypothetical protein